MSEYRIAVNEVEVVPDGILIKKCTIIDSETGQVEKTCVLNEALAEIFNRIEIDLKTYYFLKTNKNVRELINHFNLVS